MPKSRSKAAVFVNCADNLREFHKELVLKILNIHIALISRSGMMLLLSTLMPLMKTDLTGCGGHFFVVVTC